MMKKQAEKKPFSDGLFQNNKLLIIFCFLVSVVLWATVKINYSDDTTRTVSDVKVSLGEGAQEFGYTAFVDESELVVDVEVMGKAYNINAQALSKDDIVVEASGSFVDSAGYRVVSLSAKIADTATANNFEITRITPSAITVYYDRKITDTFNVVARIKNSGTIVKEGFSLGKAAPSLNTVEVSGPATVLAELENVFFDVVIPDDNLPLASTVQLKAELSYPDEISGTTKFLECITVDSETNPATVTIPVYEKKTVPTTVKFINLPEGIEAPGFEIIPSEVEIIRNPNDVQNTDEFTVATIDFRKLDNTENVFTVPIDQNNLAVRLTDKSITEFEVSVDMSGYEKTTLSYTLANVMFLNKQDGMVYSLGTGGNLDTITVIGPESSLAALTSDDIRIEINVSALNNSRTSGQLLDANISLGNSEITDCWVYGSYQAYVTVMTQQEAQALTETTTAA
ncbi:MAG: hypothetical protein IJN68_00430 [Clostridia bacterium]|nr:hypothetical protein [Clostridia bacterium]